MIQGFYQTDRSIIDPDYHDCMLSWHQECTEQVLKQNLCDEARENEFEKYRLMKQVHFLYTNFLEMFNDLDFKRKMIISHIDDGLDLTIIIQKYKPAKKFIIILIPELQGDLPDHVARQNGQTGKTLRQHAKKLEELIDFFKLLYYQNSKKAREIEAKQKSNDAKLKETKQKLRFKTEFLTKTQRESLLKVQVEWRLQQSNIKFEASIRNRVSEAKPQEVYEQTVNNLKRRLLLTNWESKLKFFCLK